MTRWQERVEELLYDGESVQETVDLDTARVVVTSHRVLAFTPGLEGENFHQIDRPNVDGVGTDALAGSETALLGRGVRIGIIGLVLLVAGYTIDFESIVGDISLDDGAAGGQLGIGGVLGMTQQLLDLITRLDELMRIFGGLVLFLAVVFLGVYWLLREPTLVIQVAGDKDDVHLPRPEDTDAALAVLEGAVLPDFASDVPNDPPAESEDGNEDESLLPDDVS